jgi:hypothetical protein
MFDVNNLQKKKIFFLNDISLSQAKTNFLKKSFFSEINRTFKTNTFKVNQLKLFKDNVLVDNVSNKKLNNLHLYIVLKQKRSSLKKNIFLNNSTFSNYTKNALTVEQVNT